ncbi:MAG: hypothetical protein ACRYFZ_09485 [Janthinobacterium lividum]
MAAFQLIVDPAYEPEAWDSAVAPITLTVNATTRVPTAHPRLDPNKVYEAEFVPDATPGSPVLATDGSGTLAISGMNPAGNYRLDLENQ